jgi:hypothetical protein
MTHCDQLGLIWNARVTQWIKTSHPLVEGKNPWDHLNWCLNRSSALMTSWDQKEPPQHQKNCTWTTRRYTVTLNGGRQRAFPQDREQDKEACSCHFCSTQSWKVWSEQLNNKKWGKGTLGRKDNFLKTICRRHDPIAGKPLRMDTSPHRNHQCKQMNPAMMQVQSWHTNANYVS